MRGCPIERPTAARKALMKVLGRANQSRFGFQAELQTTVIQMLEHAALALRDLLGGKRSVIAAGRGIDQ